MIQLESNLLLLPTEYGIDHTPKREIEQDKNTYKCFISYIGFNMKIIT